MAFSRVGPAEKAFSNMRRLAMSVVLAMTASLALSQHAQAADDESQRRAARKACLSGNFRKGVEILSDLFIRSEDPVWC
jgi:hypothetical protein